MSRLFTFGCSFTQFNWPTWAHIIAYELNIPHQNWGIAGLGNVGIHSRLLECDLRNKFNENDIIIVVWSCWGREDRFDVKYPKRLSCKWSASGGVIDSYNRHFIDNYCSLSNDIIQNSTAIISANKMFDIKFNGYIVKPTINLHSDKALAFNDAEKELALFYEDRIPNDGEYTRSEHTCSYDLVNEVHPDIMSHLAYTNEYICPKLNISLSNKTIDFFTGMHQNLSDVISHHNNTKKSKPVWQSIAKLLAVYGWQDMFKNEGF